MKHLLFILLIFLLVACSPSTIKELDQNKKETAITGQKSQLPDLGKAPELTNDVWLNTPDSLRLADLRGQVVLLEMWTFG